MLLVDDEINVKNVQRAFLKGRILNPLFTDQNGLEALDLLRGTGEGISPWDSIGCWSGARLRSAVGT